MCRTKTRQDMTIPVPVNPLFLCGRNYWADYQTDVARVTRLVDGGSLTPDDELRAAKWLAQVGFYKYVATI